MGLLSAIGGGLGLLGGLLGSRQSSRAAKHAADLSAASQRPGMWEYGEPFAKGILGAARELGVRQGFAPGPTPHELAARSRIVRQAGPAGPIERMAGSAQESWMQGLDPMANPWLDPMVEAAARDVSRAYKERVLPSISMKAEAAGGLGGSRQGVAEGVASRGYLDTLGDINAQMRGQAFRDMLGQQRAAWQAAPNMLGLGLLAPRTQMQIGEMEREDKMLPVLNLERFQSLVEPWTQVTRPGGVAYQPAGSPIAGALGGAITGARIGDWVGNQWFPNAGAGALDRSFGPGAPLGGIPGR